jgi:hypothetical protein
MRRLWHGIVRTLFWSYDRGSWPYDVMVIAILIFVLLTPRRWFNDEPQPATVAAANARSSVTLVSQDDAAQTRTYRIDANTLAPNKRQPRATPELEAETHEILGRSVDDLKGRMFQVRQIDPVSGADGSVQYYDVAVKY